MHVLIIHGYISQADLVPQTQIGFFLLKSESSFGRKDTVLMIRRPVLCPRHLCNPSHTSKGEYETQKQRLIHVLTTQYHNSQTDLVPQTGYFA